ncbi:HK97 gp10 family phage protein [Rhodobacter sp. KR11]|uniref:HK97 gp10 family phage protein n=1 Tax=Rhodobacter sp. KR11 TaxID=2974588 RepID=UPI002222D47B|nr:HK97 gp10 family phage protein [Rhodobacter sp. KR11]MCW1919969.1 HK97 gp10 family phage protein [Rhodobacter sp. KR11]
MGEDTLTMQAARLCARLEAIPAEIVIQVQPTLVACAEDLAHVARALVRKDSGALAESVTVTPPGAETPAYAEGGGRRTAGENQALVTVGNPEVRYGHFEEFGTVKAEAHPFLIPAERLTRDRSKRRIARAVSKAIKQAAQGGSDA